MTSGECFENKWFYMKYLSAEILLTRECIWEKNKGKYVDIYNGEKNNELSYEMYALGLLWI